jgi:hypothetical protein
MLTGKVQGKMTRTGADAGRATAACVYKMPLLCSSPISTSPKPRPTNPNHGPELAARLSPATIALAACFSPPLLAAYARVARTHTPFVPHCHLTPLPHDPEATSTRRRPRQQRRLGSRRWRRPSPPPPLASPPPAASCRGRRGPAPGVSWRASPAPGGSGAPLRACGAEVGFCPRPRGRGRKRRKGAASLAGSGRRGLTSGATGAAPSSSSSPGRSSPARTSTAFCRYHSRAQSLWAPAVLWLFKAVKRDGFRDDVGSVPRKLKRFFLIWI